MTDPIDPYSDYDLYDVVNDEMPTGETTEYQGFHIISSGNGKYTLNPDGFVGELETIESDNYDDVLELVAELNSHLSFWHEYTEEEQIEECGRLVTFDEEQAEENPDRFVYVPDNR